MKYIKLFNKHSEYDAYDILKPNISYCIQENEVHYNKLDWSQEYLTFEALQDGWFRNSQMPMEYSLDNGKTWVSLPANTNTPTVPAGKKILWKSTLNPGEQVGSFQSQKQFDVMGNVMSLIFGDNFQGKDDLTGYDYAFYKLMAPYTDVIDAGNMCLPAMTLSEGCYQKMLDRCSSLTTPPKLPATTLAPYCYDNMLANCTALTSTPELPATTLAPYCYQYMFFRLHLSTPPALPATTLAEGCYWAMFEQSWITTAPILPANKMEKNCYNRMFRESRVTQAILPAMELAENCYYNMFQRCTNLITAPELPATKLANNCYSGMFSGCTNLNYIKAMFTTEPGTSYTSNWVDGVSATGTFKKNVNATWDVRGTNGIPEGWTVVEEVEEEVEEPLPDPGEE